MSPFWSPPYKNLDSWTNWNHTLLQHRQLLETSGFLCKVLFKKTSGDEVGNEVDPVLISTWDATSPSPKKIIWQSGDDEDKFPDIRSIRVWVDGTELTKTYDATTIENDSEFYVVSQTNIIDVNDNVTIYLNNSFNVTGKVITYLYTTIAKNINVVENLHPSEYPNTFRTEFVNGFTQYINLSSKFRGISYPHTILISFPPNPFDTVYMGQGKWEMHVNTCWTMGDKVNYPKLSEFDIIYRVDTKRWYEIKNYNPNYIFFKGASTLATQSFEVQQLADTDDIKNFNLL